MEGVGLLGVEGHGTVGIDERLVEVALLGIGPGAAVQGNRVVGLCRQHLVIVGDGAVVVAFVVEDAAVVDQRVDVIWCKAQCASRSASALSRSPFSQ